jgi:NAD(P)-dependent dehydrogenase (short-subunit alcohol dehydrogenase family)
VGLVDGKCGLVTGAAGGIGAAVARCLAAEGASVLLTDLEASRANAEATVSAIREAGGQAAFVAADVADEDDQRGLVEHCVSQFGQLDYAHNNAGVELHGSAEDTSVEDWDRLMDINLTGVWLGMKYQMAQMRRQGTGGSIINTSSLAGIMGFPGFAAYVAAKWGVVGLTRAGAVEGADAGIRVNTIVPTAVRTPMIDRFAPDLREQLVAPQSIKRLSEPEEVAEAVVWLASDRSSLVTGGPFNIELGTVARYAV